MALRRLLALGLAALAAAYAALLLWTESERGFPDGHLTELDRALRAPRIGAALVALALAAALARGGWSARVRIGLGLALGVVVVVERLGLPTIGAALGYAGGGGG